MICDAFTIVAIIVILMLLTRYTSEYLTSCPRGFHLARDKCISNKHHNGE